MTERFKTHLGANANSEWICSLSDDELADEINKLNYWDTNLIRDLCWRADITDEEWDEAIDDFEPLIRKAAQILDVEIDCV